ncbi:hypothetical protein EDB87DRAFT_1124431 [Lactarius vividus]|nr:hypothetical protein EDB87DRAFT_1124431 [Lactarius vividus]
MRAAVSEAQVLSVPAGAKGPQGRVKLVQATLERFGRFDVLIANAGAVSDLNKKDPERWWNTSEVNIRGVFLNVVRASLVSTLETISGHIVVSSSVVTQLRFLCASDHTISKHAVNRLVEFISLEYPKLAVFALHPSYIKTQLSTGEDDSSTGGIVFYTV